MIIPDWRILNDDKAWDILWTVLWFLLGTLFTGLWKWIRERFRARRLNRTLRRLAEDEQKLRITTMAVGPWPLGSQLHVRDTNLSFHIPFPPDLLPKLRSQYDARGKTFSECFVTPGAAFLDATSYTALGEECGIPDFDDLIEYYRREVAGDFIEARNGLYFNHDKFGVYEIDATARMTNDEHPLLSIALYRTDYFTHQVMRRIFAVLKRRGHAMTAVSDQEDLRRFRVFTTSLGLNAVLLLKNEKEAPVFALARRSKLASGSTGGTPYHITMNEGLSVTDYDTYTNEVSFSQWLKRGLWEELHLSDALLGSRMKRASFDALFLVNDVFELGIVSTIELEGMTMEELESCAKQAKDHRLEIFELAPVPATSADVQEFLATHEMLAAGRYSFIHVVAREGIAVKPGWWEERAPRPATSRT
jgi:hypothetical protein